MRVLTVLAHPPLPEGGASGKCAVGLLQGLREHGIEPRVLVGRDVFLLRGLPVFGGPEHANGPPFEIWPIRPGAGGLRGYVDVFRRPMAPFRDEAFVTRIRTLADEVDVVHLEQTQMLFAAKETAKPSVVHIQSLIRRDRPLGWPWQSIFRSNLEFLITERALRRLPYLVANSPVVAEHLRQVAPRAEVVVAPVTVDPDLYPRAPLDGPPTAGIIGTGTWPPTARSMRRLVDRIWPHVRRSVPDARLLIAGRGLRPGLSGAPGVEVLGPVRSASEFLRGLSLLLYPLDRGSGMKVKVLESIAAGVPVVTTREGAEGIRGDDGVVVEEDDERLAAAAVRILHDERERRERGAAARRAFDERYAPRPATEPLVELYRRIASI